LCRLGRRRKHYVRRPRGLGQTSPRLAGRFASLSTEQIVRGGVNLNESFIMIALGGDENVISTACAALGSRRVCSGTEIVDRAGVTDGSARSVCPLGRSRDRFGHWANRLVGCSSRRLLRQFGLGWRSRGRVMRPYMRGLCVDRFFRGFRGRVRGMNVQDCSVSGLDCRSRSQFRCGRSVFARPRGGLRIYLHTVL
jgi:hypothetical protein